MPFVPRSQFVLVDDPADGDEALAVVDPFRANLNWRTVRRQIRALPHFLEIHIGADENGFAVFARRLHAARPAERNLCAAIRTTPRGLRHRAAPPKGNHAPTG